jgi:predicted N-acetyltransferase YhbS
VAERTRSEYRLALDADGREPHALGALVIERPDVGAIDALAALLLDAYRGSVDDEGETQREAVEAMSDFLEMHIPEYSVVVRDGADYVAFSFVVLVNGVHYIDPVVTAARRKRQGLGSLAVSLCLDRLRAGGVREVGAVITDGNKPSERLFATLGFTRVGPWQ